MSGEKLLLPKRLAVFAVIAAVALSAIATASDSYVFRDGDITWMFGRGMPSAALQKIQSQYGGTFIWAHRGAHTYVIRDAATIEQARIAIAPHLTRSEQEHRLAHVVADAIRSGAARRID